MFNNEQKTPSKSHTLYFLSSIELINDIECSDLWVWKKLLWQDKFIEIFSFSRTYKSTLHELCHLAENAPTSKLISIQMLIALKIYPWHNQRVFFHHLLRWINISRGKAAAVAVSAKNINEKPIDKSI